MIAATRARRDAVVAGGTIGLLSAILTGTPKLAGAACRNRPELFDPQHDGESRHDAAQRHAAAVEICQQCPVLRECSDWADRTRPSRRPGGVLAGRTNPTPRRGRPAATSPR